MLPHGILHVHSMPGILPTTRLIDTAVLLLVLLLALTSKAQAGCDHGAAQLLLKPELIGSQPPAESFGTGKVESGAVRTTHCCCLMPLGKASFNGQSEGQPSFRSQMAQPLLKNPFRVRQPVQAETRGEQGRGLRKPGQGGPEIPSKRVGGRRVLAQHGPASVNPKHPLAGMLTLECFSQITGAAAEVHPQSVGDRMVPAVVRQTSGHSLLQPGG